MGCRHPYYWADFLEREWGLESWQWGIVWFESLLRATPRVESSYPRASSAPLTHPLPVGLLLAEWHYPQVWFVIPPLRASPRAESSYPRASFAPLTLPVPLGLLPVESHYHQVWFVTPYHSLPATPPVVLGVISLLPAVSSEVLPLVGATPHVAPVMVLTSPSPALPRCLLPARIYPLVCQ